MIVTINETNIRPLTPRRGLQVYNTGDLMLRAFYGPYKYLWLIHFFQAPEEVSTLCIRAAEVKTIL